MNSAISSENDVKDEDGFERNKNTAVLSRMALNDNKAGMKGLDKEKINKIIHENSVGSKFYENERKKDAQVDARIQKMLEQVEKLTPEQMETSLGRTNAILKELESSRDLSRTIVHIDMDAFYASVEERDNPELKNKPMAVGGSDMLSTSNYIARRYGVRAAMPGFIAKKLCPELILVPLNFGKYREVSAQVREILAEYDSNFSPMGLDEAYLDITSYLKTKKSTSMADETITKTNALEEQDDMNPRHQSDEKVGSGTAAEEVVNEMRSKIQQVTQLTASAGIACNTFLAKVASDMNKPNGQFYLEPTRESVMEFVKNLPIRKVPGIGKVTEKMLNALGVKICQDIYDNMAVLHAVFSSVMSNSLLRICIGIGSTILENESERKSISTERTFRDISNHQEMFQKCEELCEALEADVKKADVKGMTVTLKIKTAAFELHTRSKTLFYPVGCKREIYPVISDLLKQELAANKGQMKLRLIGVGLSKLSNAGKDSQQKSLDYFIQKVKAKKKSQDTDTLASSIKNSEYHPDSSVTSSAVTSSECDSIQTTDLEDGGQREIVNGTNASTTSSNKGPSEHILNLCNDAADKEINCPICEKEFNDLCALNKHLDECGITQNNKNGYLKGHTEIEENNSVNNNDLTQQITCFTCPLCNATFCCQDITLEKFNTHVDSCLNRKTIMELVKSESNYANSDSEKTKTKRNSKTSGPPRKRQKTTSKPSCTIDNFFKK